MPIQNEASVRHRPDRVFRTGLAAVALILFPRVDLSAQVTRRPFDHKVHTSVQCVACHTSPDSHGRIGLRSSVDCQTCHHRNATAQTCANCHTSAPDADRPFTARVAMHIDSQSRTRDLSFVHTKHAATPCATCHSQIPSMATTPGLCATCHTEHHKTDRNCESCHQEPPPTAHSKASHLTCGGAGCHAADFVEGDMRTRQVCLACHVKQRDHRPGEVCVNCHVLPPFQTSGDTDR